MLIYLFFSIVMYFSGLLIFSKKQKQFLLMLLSLEFIILSLYFNLLICMSFFFSYEYYFNMIFLTMSVYEGALGLSLLVSLIRTHGSDYFQVFNMLW